MTIEVKETPLDQIKEYERNARTHSKEQIAQIAESIRQFGFTNPVLIDRDGVLIAGHGRLAAARTLAMKAVPTITLDKLNPAQVKALRIADNKIALNSGWDVAALAEEFGKLADVQFDLALTGFSLKEVKFATDRGDVQIEQIDQAYTRKVKSPVYEITGKRPGLAELFDTKKVRALIEEIEASSQPEAVKAFLIEAAHRHAVFNYAKIAEFYAHADADLQTLMEKSALVIIDFNAAIENGYVKLTDELAQMYREDYVDAS